jgi:hypothetical protein
MNEFQLTLTNITAKRGTSVSEVARSSGYDRLLFENIVTGKSRQIPVDFFVRIADVLGLTNIEKDALVRSWAFGVERWNWPQTSENRERQPAKRQAG